MYTTSYKLENYFFLYLIYNIKQYMNIFNNDNLYFLNEDKKNIY